MKKLFKLISLTLVAISAIVLLTACPLFADIDPADTIYVPDVELLSASDDSDASEGNENADEDGIRDIEAGIVPLTRAPAIPNVIMPEASGRLVEKNNKMAIDHSNTDDGYIMVRWLANTTKQLRVQVTGPSDTTYTYTIHPDEMFEVFPLSDGNGSYSVNVFEQVEGSRYALAGGIKLRVTLVDEFAPFLRPNQFVNFHEESDVVMKAAELVSGDYGFLEKIAAVYEFVVNHLSYDRDFANEVIAGHHRGYLPDLDRVLARGRGICFDYAALMTAMLRSQSIPTKLVIGYAGDVKHAWINVFSEETGWIDQLIFFDGENWLMMDPTFASGASSPEALEQFIGDGSMYTETHLY